VRAGASPDTVESARALDTALDERKQRLESILHEMGSMVVAFSGGVDSTLLLRVVAGQPGLRYLAVTTDSPTNTRLEVEEARAYARSFGAPHAVVGANELETPGYADNPANRCYLCKQTLYPLCFDVAREEGLAWVVDGVNTDDLGDYRPGLQAAEEMGVRHPLVEAGLSKADGRRLSAYFGLPTADKPASPCLSSRFPYGTAITEARLRQVEQAEAYLHELGFVELRVRHLGRGARVEVSAGELPRMADEHVRDRIRERLGRLGFDEVDICEKPLRSGSLNDALFARDARGST